MRNNLLLNVKEDDIDVSAMVQKTFSIEEKLELSTKLFEEGIQESEYYVKGNIEDDEWIILSNRTYTHLTFNFKEYKQYFNFSSIDYSGYILNLKCWLVQQLATKSADNVYSSFIADKKVVQTSNGYNINYIEDTIEYLIENYSDSTLKDLLLNQIDFLTYWDNTNTLEYKNSFISYSDKIKEDIKNAKLPSSKHILDFSYSLEEWFKSQEKKSTNFNLILFYPLYLWWKLTNIIPMRPSEFCLIARDCLVIENDKYYIKLSRRKSANKRKIQIPDKLLISKEMSRIIIDYINLTEDFGVSKTLISYRSIEKAYISLGILRGETNKIDKNYFTSPILTKLINNFYKQIMKINTEDTSIRLITPYSTRHLSILNMMFQGYNPLEIARMAGHTRLETQYSYSNHMEYWVDSEIKRLVQEFYQNASSENDFSETAEEKVENIKNTVFIKKNSNVKIPLDIGYCTDETMPCPVINNKFSGCYYCNLWGIDELEFQEKRDIILKEISEEISSIKIVSKTLLSLYQKSGLDSGKVNNRLVQGIQSTSKKLNAKMDGLKQTLERLREVEEHEKTKIR